MLITHLLQSQRLTNVATTKSYANSNSSLAQSSDPIVVKLAAYCLQAANAEGCAQSRVQPNRGAATAYVLRVTSSLSLSVAKKSKVFFSRSLTARVSPADQRAKRCMHSWARSFSLGNNDLKHAARVSVHTGASPKL